jgi:hypothetical protein
MQPKESPVKKFLATAALSAALAGGALVAASPANARPRPPKPPAVNCTNAPARYDQLVAEFRALLAERAVLDARTAANLIPGTVRSVVSETEAELLLQLTGDNNIKQTANSQARYNLSVACGTPNVRINP